jgi:hypothetical protein
VTQLKQRQEYNKTSFEYSYSEPDVNWWLKENAEDFTGMNVMECSAMINELNRLGNTKAELKLATQNKENLTIKHPHSWSIVGQ